MKKLITTTLLVVTFLGLSISTLFAQSDRFNVAKTLEIQNNILNTLKMQYVDSVKLEKLLKTGIDAMLASLDPYTVYIPEEDEEDIDLMTTGSYGGVGSIIKKLPSGEVCISEPYEGSPSVKVGLEPGDLILEIDGVDTHTLDATQSSAKMRGRPGTELNLKVLKGRTLDTINVTLIRERIHVSDVVYYGMIRDTLGYIQVEGFTLDGYKDVRNALERLKAMGTMKRLVIDLRSNGGGLMSEAIDLVSLFVPSGTLVVTSKGLDTNSFIEFRTQKEPVDITLPLVVLVNSGSASSSEIVAGALQDLDRATIAGTRTFGKGLVQSISSLGYNTSLKLTTAKYYTPSGRCVQGIDYSNRNEDGSVGHIPDSLKKEFKTANGRSVYDGGGITPDIILEPKYFTRPLMSLLYSDILGDYAIEYYKKHKSIATPDKFSLTDAEYEDFITFAAAKNFDSRTESQIEMDNLIKAAKREGLYEKSAEEFESLLKSVTLNNETFLRHNKNDIKKSLEQEICIRYYFQRGGAQSALRGDVQLSKI